MSEVDTQSTYNLIEFVLRTVPVVVGGLIAIAGGFFGSWFTQRLITLKEAKNLRLQKIEELLSSAVECDHWLDEYKNSRIGDELYTVGHSPIERVKYLSAIYAPELKEEVNKLSLAHANYVELIASCYAEKLKSGSVPGRFLQEYQEKYINVSRAIDGLVDRAVLVIEQRKP